jgi:hypothetical protein
MDFEIWIRQWKILNNASWWCPCVTWLLICAQIKKYESVPAGKHRKSIKHGSSIPTGKSLDFFRWLPARFSFFPTENIRKSPKKNPKNFWPKYCFHVPSIFKVFCWIRWLSQLFRADFSEIQWFPKSEFITLGDNRYNLKSVKMCLWICSISGCFPDVHDIFLGGYCLVVSDKIYLWKIFLAHPRCFGGSVFCT